MAHHEATPLPLLIRRSQLKNLVGMAPSTVDRLEREGVFPARRRIGVGTVGWLRSEVEEFLNRQPKINGEG